MELIGLVGLILPPVIDLINQFIQNRSLRFLFALGFCAIVGILVNFLSLGGHLGTIQEVVNSIMIVFGSSQLTYNGIWEESKIRANMLN